MTVLDFFFFYHFFSMQFVAGKVQKRDQQSKTAFTGAMETVVSP